MQLQAICGLYISYLSNLGGFHPNFRIIIYLFFSAEKVHSKSQQHKCVETLKVISSSFWITVQWHVKTVLLPLFDIKFHSSTRKTYRGCMCTVSTWASDYYTSPEHSSCYISFGHVSCLGSVNGKLSGWQANWYWNWGPRVCKPPPNVLGQSVLAGWRGYSRLPCCEWVLRRHTELTHTLCLYVSISRSLWNSL